MMNFWKYHGLGNDYLVVESSAELTSNQIQRICDRHYGIGSDGILVQVDGGDSAEFGVQIYNPDGSSAEKSGNGLRIFARYLFDTKQVSNQPFTVSTLGGLITAHVLTPNKVRVSMGRAVFEASESLQLNQKLFEAHIVSMGNPHCVIFDMDGVDTVEAHASQWGAALETHPRFPQRTNVQFAYVIDRANLYIAIWERGAGRTLASGSSSCAAAAVAYRLGYCDHKISVQMAGGSLNVEIDLQDGVILQGGVTKVGQGTISAEIFHQPHST